MAPETMATEVIGFNMDSYVNVELDAENDEAVEEQQNASGTGLCLYPLMMAHYTRSLF